MKSVIIIPDVHIPFHDKAAWGLVKKVIKATKPAYAIILGDFGDFYSVSGHQKSPKQRNLLLVDEVDAVNRELDALDDLLGSAEKHFIQGNHEWRLDRYIAQRAPELFGLTTTEKLFKLKRRGWRYTSYNSHVKVGHVYYKHDTGKAGANAHRQAEAAFSHNAVIGHTHRMALDVRGNIAGHNHVCAMFGWLGDIHAAEYMHLVNARRDWTLGFGTGWMKPDGTTFLQAHPIVRGEVCVDGKVFSQTEARKLKAA